MDMISVNVVQTLPTGIQEAREVASSVYPNPTNGQVRIAFDEQYSSNVTINVFSPLGTLVSSQLINSVGYVDYELPEIQGVYLLQVLYSDGITDNHRVIRE
jgi:hypothetical protein